MDLELSDLYNPRKITELFHKRKATWICIDPNLKDQGFQERPGSVELWQKMEDGRLFMIQRWLHKSVIPSDGDRLMEW